MIEYCIFDTPKIIWSNSLCSSTLADVRKWRWSDTVSSSNKTKNVEILTCKWYANESHILYTKLSTHEMKYLCALRVSHSDTKLWRAEWHYIALCVQFTATPCPQSKWHEFIFICEIENHRIAHRSSVDSFVSGKRIPEWILVAGPEGLADR